MHNLETLGFPSQRVSDSNFALISIHTFTKPPFFHTYINAINAVNFMFRTGVFHWSLDFFNSSFQPWTSSSYISPLRPLQISIKYLEIFLVSTTRDLSYSWWCWQQNQCTSTLTFQGSRSDPLMHPALSSIHRALPWIAFTISQSTALHAWHPCTQNIRLLTRDPTISSKYPYRTTLEWWLSKAGLLHLQIFVRPLTLPAVSIQEHAWYCTVLVYS